MVNELKACPNHWRRRCHPRPCDFTPQPQPTKPVTGGGQPVTGGGQPVTGGGQPTTQPQSTHNVVYLVDEHNVTSNPSQTPVRNGPTLQRRWAWHHQVVNLVTLNVPEVPDTITLHEAIADAKKPPFKWEGYMFDIPGGNASLRVGIVADADKANDKTLTGPGGKDGSDIDRVVGFAGVYPDNTVPYGPLIQVRRDDSYRLLGASLNKDEKVKWHCAYYITKETPKQPTPPKTAGFGGFTLMPEGDPDAPPGTEITSAGGSAPTGDPASADDPPVESLTYDQLLDRTVDDGIAVKEGAPTWGGMVFGFQFADSVQPSDPNDLSAIQPYSDSALLELGAHS